MGKSEDVMLQERDWQFILDSIYRINSITDVDTFQNEVLSCLRTLTPSYQGSFFMITMDHGIARSSRPVVIGAEPHLLDKFGNNYDDDPYFNGLYLKPLSYAFRDTDMIPDEVRKSSPVYNEIYLPEKLHFALRTLLSHNNAIIGEIALFNTMEEGDFTDKDVYISNQLAPHIALRLADLLEKEKSGTQSQREQEIIAEYDLTLREFQIIQMVLEGQQERNIADSLCISLSTVKKHMYNAYRKLNVNNRIQLRNIFDER